MSKNPTGRWSLSPSCGARDGALASFRLKHLNLSASTLFRDGREVDIKRRKTCTSCFFPVGPEPLEIVTDYIATLIRELSFGPDDPLFPSTGMAQGPDRGIVAIGLTSEPWRTTDPIRQVFREAFEGAGLPICQPARVPEDTRPPRTDYLPISRRVEGLERKFGPRKRSDDMTFVGYGKVQAHRQAEIMRMLAAPRPTGLPQELDLDALESFLRSAKGGGSASAVVVSR